MQKMLWLLRELVGGHVLEEIRTAISNYYRTPTALCPICGKSSVFLSQGPRTAERCPNCQSLPRQRLIAVAAQQGRLSFTGKDVLHFAAEPSLARFIDEHRPARRLTSSYPDHSADLGLNIEEIELPDAQFDTIICSHVLEHVDDSKALPELRRILKPGGQLLIEVPIIEAWPRTYENPEITSPEGRHLHFGQFDHVRYYGRDLRDRISQAGLVLTEFTAAPEDLITYGLERGETLFIATRPG